MNFSIMRATTSASSNARWWLNSGRPRCLRDDVELVPPELGQQALREDERVHHDGAELYAVALAGGGHEARVEGGVVRDYGPAAAEVEEGAHGLGLAGRAGDVAVLYAGELGDVRGDVHPRVDEGGEGLEHLPAREAHRAYLGEPVRRGGEAGRLHVEGDELARRAAASLSPRTAMPESTSFT